jgi:hydrogenase maturation factor HypE
MRLLIACETMVARQHKLLNHLTRTFHEVSVSGQICGVRGSGDFFVHRKILLYLSILLEPWRVADGITLIVSRQLL